MTKTSKTVAIVAGVVLVLFLCACMIVGGLYFLGKDSTPTPTAVPSQEIHPTQTIQPNLPVPPLAPPTIIPPTLAPVPTATEVTTLPFDADINLNGTTLKVFSVVYTTINGGEDSVAYVENPEQVYFLVSLYSADKDLSFFYNNYQDSILLIDPVKNQSVEFDYMNWSLDDTPANNGYLKISFPISEPMTQAVLHITDGVDIDLSPLIPTGTEYQSPWIDVAQPFTLDGVPLQIQSAEIYDEYINPVKDTPVEKDNPTDKIIVLKFTSSQNDLSYLGDSALPYILVDGTNQYNQYDYDYIAWTTAENTGDGELLYIFIVPQNVGSYVLYIPFDTLIDLTSILTVR